MALDPTDTTTTTGTTGTAETEKKRSGGLAAKENRRLIAGAILGALVAVFAVLNRDDVDVNWIVGAGNTPLIVVIAVSFAFGLAVGYLTRRTRERRKSA
jgi:uncharacterized integral membrane protein